MATPKTSKIPKKPSTFKPKRRKTGGRVKGTPNRTPTEIREAFQMLLSKNLDNMQKWILEIEDPGKRVDLIVKIAEFVLPKLSRVDLTEKSSPDDNKIVILMRNENPFIKQVN
jgi:hypothetical protein